MKMKRVIALLLCLMMLTGIIAVAVSCGTTEEECTHTFSEIWSSDAEGHWHEATCGCEDAPMNKADHYDNNNDGACDVCVYSDHTHTYADGWTVDCTNHWHAADCGHVVPGADVAAHVDEDNDGKCDECNYIIEDIHVHCYATEWSFDADYHWHAAICEHGAEIADREAHNIDAAGFCSICDQQVREVDMTDPLAVLAAAQARSHKVIDGTVIEKQIVYDGNNGMVVGSTEGLTLLNSGVHDVFFVLGDESSYVFLKSFTLDGTYIGGDQQWFEKISDEEVFCVVMEHGNYELVIREGTPKQLNGYNYLAGSILPSEADDTSTLANFLTGLYGIVETGTNVKNVVSGYDEATGKYSLSFEYLQVNHMVMNNPETGEKYDEYHAYVYFADIWFTIDENYVINFADIYIESYRNWVGDPDITYDPTDNSYAPTSNCNPSVYSYSVSQNSGDRTYTTPFHKSSLEPKDFELTYVTAVDEDVTYVVSEEPIVDTDGDGIVDLVLEKGEYTRLHVGNLIPSTALASAMNIDQMVITYKNTNPDEAGQLWQDKDFLRPGYSKYMDCIHFNVADAGDYILTIDFGGISKTIHVTVPGDPVLAVPEDTADTEYVWVTDTYTYVDMDSIVATESGTYTFTIPAGVGFQSQASYDAGEAPEVDVFDPYTDTTIPHTVSVDLVKGSTFYYYVGALEEGIYAIAVDFVPGEVLPDGPNAPALEGSYTLSGPANGELVITATDTFTGSFTVTLNGRTDSYTFRIDGETFFYSMNGGLEYQGTKSTGMGQFFGFFTFDADGNLATFYKDGDYTITPAGGSTDPEPDPEPEEPEEPVVLPTLSVGANDIVVTAEDKAAGGIKHSFVVTNAGEYKFSSSYLMVRVYDAEENLIGTGTVYLEPGNYIANVITAYVSGAGTYSVNVEYTAPAGAGGNGSESDPYVWDELPESIEIDSDTINKIYYVYTATADGTITVTWVSGDSWGDWYELDADGNTTANNDSSNQSEVMIFNVEAGKTYRIGIGTYDNAGVFTINFAFTEGEVGGDEPGDEEPEEVEVKGIIYDDETNTVVVTEEDLANGSFYLSFMPWNSGEYQFAGDLFITAITAPDGTVIGRNDNSAYELEIYTRYILTVSTNYIFAAGDYTITPEYTYPEGHAENPIWISLYDESFDASVPAYETVWHTFYAGENGTLTFTTDAAGVTLYLGMSADVAVGGEGTVSLGVFAGVQYYIGVYSESDVDATVTSSFTAGEVEVDGSANLPYAMVIGDNDVELDGGCGAYFMYKATANGTLTLNVTAGTIQWYNASADMYDAEPLVFEVQIDDVIIIYVENSDFMEATSATFTATLDADPTVVYYENQVITDGSAANQIVLEENTFSNVNFGGAGKYVITWDNADAIVELVSYMGNTTLTNGEVITGSNWGTDLYVRLPDYAAGTVNLTIAPYVDPGVDLIVGENTVSVNDTQFGNVVNLPTSDEDVTYIITVGTNVVMINGVDVHLAGETVEITVPAGQTVSFNVATEDYSKSDVTINVAIKVNEGGDNPGETPEIPVVPETGLAGNGTSSDPYVIPELPYTINQTSAFDYYYTLTIPGNGTLVIAYELGTYIDGLPGGANKDSFARTWTLEVTAGQVVKFNAYATNPKEYNITITFTEAQVVEPEPEPTPDPETPTLSEIVPSSGAGTSSNRYQITGEGTLTHEGKHDMYYVWTAPKTGTLVIGYTAGGYVSDLPGSAVKDSAACTYTFDVVEGQTYKINPWSNGSAVYVYTISYLNAPEVDDGGDEPEQGGGDTSEAITLVSAVAANGKTMTVAIDAAADTISVTRSGGTTTYVFSYSALVAQCEANGGSVSMPKDVNGNSTNISSITLDENGMPSSITWMGVNFTDYTIQ